MLSYLDMTYSRPRCMAELELIGTLSSSLEKQVAFSLFSGALHEFKFFQKQFDDSATVALCGIVEEQLHPSEDLILKQGSQVDTMVFILVGMLACYRIEHSPDRSSECVVYPDWVAFCWLGEMALFYTNDVVENWSTNYQASAVVRALKV